MRTFISFLCVILFATPAFAAVNIPITVNVSETVTVTGTPRITVDVGGTTRYATYTSGTGTNTLTFTLSPLSGDVDMDGITVMSPIQLNGGTITDLSGNAATLTFTPPDTSNVKINAAIPSGYTTSFTDRTVTNVNKSNASFSFTYNKTGRTYHYTISSSGGGTPLTGSGATTGTSQTISGLDLTSLADGKITLSLTISDSLGGVGLAVTDTIPKAILDSNLIGYWTFDANDISGTTVYDRSGNARDGAMVDGPTSTPGKVGDAVALDGSNDRIQGITATPYKYTGATGMTISLWVNIDSSETAGYLMTRPWNGVGQYNYWFQYVAGTTLNFRLMGATVYDLSFASPPTRGSWAHIAATVDTSNNVKLYLNGTLSSSGTHSIASWAPPSGDGGYTPCIGSIFPYASGWAGNTSFAIKGKIDDVRYYNRALSGSEIATLYAAEN